LAWDRSMAKTNPSKKKTTTTGIMHCS
jgi:hypothetical protein